MNTLEATRRAAPDAVFVHMSTNKVYGDKPNELALKELDTRWDFADAADFNGIAETFSIDQSKHSLFGASKVAGDVMVQEYGRYFGMRASRSATTSTATTSRGLSRKSGRRQESARSIIWAAAGKTASAFWKPSRWPPR
jgi:dTDP-D-glucose 4,6-dehydratase